MALQPADLLSVRALLLMEGVLLAGEQRVHASDLVSLGGDLLLRVGFEMFVLGWFAGEYFAHLCVFVNTINSVCNRERRDGSLTFFMVCCGRQ